MPETLVYVRGSAIRSPTNHDLRTLQGGALRFASDTMQLLGRHCPGLEKPVSHILVKIEFDQFLDLLGFALSLHAVTVQKYQQLSKILVWKNLVSHINFFFR